MPVTITITADSGPLAAREMANMISEVGKSYVEMRNGAAPLPTPTPVATKPAPEKTAEPKETPKAEEPKEEKKPKKKAAKAGEDDGEEVEETLDGCRVMAKRVAASDGKDGTAGGITKANKIIESFGIAQLSKIPPEKYSAFIAECKKALDAKEPEKKADEGTMFD